MFDFLRVNTACQLCVTCSLKTLFTEDYVWSKAVWVQCGTVQAIHSRFFFIVHDKGMKWLLIVTTFSVLGKINPWNSNVVLWMWQSTSIWSTVHTRTIICNYLIVEFHCVPLNNITNLPQKYHCQWVHWERHLWEEKRERREEFWPYCVTRRQCLAIAWYGDRVVVCVCEHALISLTCLTPRHISSVHLTLSLSSCIDITDLALCPRSLATCTTTENFTVQTCTSTCTVQLGDIGWRSSKKIFIILPNFTLVVGFWREL